MSKPNRTCTECGVEKTDNHFFHSHPVCRKCVNNSLRIPLTDKVEAHRQEKETRRLLKLELKKIARARIEGRKRRRKLRAQKELIPQVHEGEAVAVLPEVKELAKRELSRRRLIEFIKEFHPRYNAGWVHYDICKRLEKFVADVVAGKSPRLMILMPPRHGKSQIASKMLPPWTLGHYPHFEIIACSYNVSLALEFSREARGIVRSDRYKVLFPKAQIDESAQGAEAWKLLSNTGTGAGGYVAAGIGGPITGKGAHILIIDDPIKNAEEAESAEQRGKIWDWYRSTAYTRLAPGGGVLVIQTWWHDDDLAGRLQEEMKADPEADQFEIVKYPATAIEDEEYRMTGDPLHPERYSLEALMKIKRTIGPRYWAALYQQDPVPDEGAFFTRDQIVRREGGLNIQNMHLYQSWDFALGDKKMNDWNVGITFGLDYNDDEHVLEVRRFKTIDLEKVAGEVLDAFERFRRPGVLQVAVEDGKEWRGMQGYLRKRMKERSIYPAFEEFTSLTDKAARARPLQGRMQQRKVTLPKADRPEIEALIKELLRFPSGIHDDCVDALAQGTRMILGKAPPRPPVFKNRKREPTLAERLARLARKNGGGSAMAA